MVPIWLDLLFIAICLLTIGLFFRANPGMGRITLIIIVWSVLQSILAWMGVYQDMNQFPPPFLLVLVPPVLMILYGSTGNRIRKVESQRNLVRSTLIHTIRIPVEFVLYMLFCYGMVPELMTFAGRNYDILSGITAPFIALLYLRHRMGDRGLFIWNLICLGLVLFILVNGVLSTEMPFQQFAFDQPNLAVTLFPYILLPATIVPVVIYSHISDLLILSRKMSRNEE